MDKKIEDMKRALNEASIRRTPKKRTLSVESLVYDDDIDEKDDYEEDVDEINIESENIPSVDIKGIIKSIRLQVLKGLAQIAEHPESDEYEVLKRLLTICDKPMEKQSAGLSKNQ